MNKGGGNRIISGGVQNRFWGGDLWYGFLSPEFSPPFVFLWKSLSWERPDQAQRSPGPFGPGTPKESEKSPKGCAAPRSPTVLFALGFRARRARETSVPGRGVPKA